MQLFTRWFSGRRVMINCMKIDRLVYKFIRIQSSVAHPTSANESIITSICYAVSVPKHLFSILASPFQFYRFYKIPRRKEHKIKSRNWGDLADSKRPPTGWVNSVTAGGRTNDFCCSWFRLWFVVDANTITFDLCLWEYVCHLDAFTYLCACVWSSVWHISCGMIWLVIG